MIIINRGEAAQIPFKIDDTLNALAGKRVTCAIGAPGASPTLAKASGLGVSSADVTINPGTQTAGHVDGTVNIAIADYNTLTQAQYNATLWVDDNAGGDRVAIPGAVDTIKIQVPVKRT